MQCKAQAGEDDGEEGGDRVSVTGLVYAASVPSSPQVTLYTKFQCTLCDKVVCIFLNPQPLTANPVSSTPSPTTRARLIPRVSFRQG